MKQQTKAPFNTVLLLTLQYQTPAVKLDDILEDYLPSLSRVVANKMAKAQQLPFPVFKTMESNKAPWMVSIFDLAAHIDKVRQQATEDHEKMSC